MLGGGSKRSFNHGSLNGKEKFFLYNLFKILSNFLIIIANPRSPTYKKNKTKINGINFENNDNILKCF